MRKLTPRVLGGTLIGLALVLGASLAAARPTTTRITDNSSIDQYPDTSGSNVVWGGHDGNDYEIYLMRGAPPAANLVPSISFDGLALLGGLVLGIVAWARRGR